MVSLGLQGCAEIFNEKTTNNTLSGSGTKPFGALDAQFMQNADEVCTLRKDAERTLCVHCTACGGFRRTNEMTSQILKKIEKIQIPKANLDKNVPQA